MGDDLNLSPEERQLILDRRRDADRNRFVVAGIFEAAAHLNELGRQCAGGDGEATNPSTGKPYGQQWFDAEMALRRFGAAWKPR